MDNLKLINFSKTKSMMLRFLLKFFFIYFVDFLNLLLLLLDNYVVTFT